MTNQAGARVPGKKRKWLVHSHDATRPAKAAAMSEINVTPMIDVLLVLLIIFMVVTPIAQRGLDIALPQPAPQDQPDTPTKLQIVLAVDKDGMSVNKSPVATLDELDTRLKDIFQARADKTLFVKGSGDVAYGKIVEAMDIARGAGVERIGIISESLVAAAGGEVAGEASAPAVEGGL